MHKRVARDFTSARVVIDLGSLPLYPKYRRITCTKPAARSRVDIHQFADARMSHAQGSEDAQQRLVYFAAELTLT